MPEQQANDESEKRSAEYKDMMKKATEEFDRGFVIATAAVLDLYLERVMASACIPKPSRSCSRRLLRASQDERAAARSRSMRSVTSLAMATEPSTSSSAPPLTIAKVISTYILRPLLCSARVSVGRP
jgi:hypothetical protein